MASRRISVCIGDFKGWPNSTVYMALTIMPCLNSHESLKHCNHFKVYCASSAHTEFECLSPNYMYLCGSLRIVYDALFATEPQMYLNILYKDTKTARTACNFNFQNPLRFYPGDQFKNLKEGSKLASSIKEEPNLNGRNSDWKIGKLNKSQVFHLGK